MSEVQNKSEFDIGTIMARSPRSMTLGKLAKLLPIQTRLKRDAKAFHWGSSMSIYELLISVCKDKQRYLPPPGCLQSQTEHPQRPPTRRVNPSPCVVPNKYTSVLDCGGRSQRTPPDFFFNVCISVCLSFLLSLENHNLDSGTQAEWVTESGG